MTPAVLERLALEPHVADIAAARLIGLVRRQGSRAALNLGYRLTVREQRRCAAAELAADLAAELRAYGATGWARRLTARKSVADRKAALAAGAVAELVALLAGHPARCLAMAALEAVPDLWRDRLRRQADLSAALACNAGDRAEAARHEHEGESRGA